MSPDHIVVLGAARSGTKVLRDALAQALTIGRVPYDVGYVWRYGNECHPDDTLGGRIGTERTRAFIRGFIDRYQAGDPPAVIEKTVGNVLRLRLVATVFPAAHYVHLVRDGVDVIESARRQWTAPPDIGYLWRKALHFPVRLAPSYGWKYVRAALRRRRPVSGSISSWGPRYPGIDADLRRHDQLTVCARQWRHSVCLARQDLRRLGLPVIEVRYEDLVHDPVCELTRVASFVGAEVSPQALAAGAALVRPGRAGVGRAALTADELAVVEAEVGDLLAELGYPAARGMEVG